MKTFYIILSFFFLSYASIGYCQTAKDYNDRGVLKFNAGNYTGAISDFSKSIELNPRDADVYYNRGVAKAKLSDYRGALYDYQKTLDINPKCTFVYSHRGFSKYHLKDYTGAVLDLTKAIDIDPTDHGSYNLRGLAKVRLNDYNGAISDYTKAIEIRPNFELNYYSRGDLKFKNKNYTEAISDFSRVIEIDPNNVFVPRAFYMRGLSKFELGQNESGCLDLYKARELDFSDADEAIKKYCKELLYKKLYEALNQAGYYTKSEDKFHEQFGTPEGQQKLYKSVNDAGYYTKSLEEFKKQFFSGTQLPGEDSTNFKFNSNQTSIYSFLKKNNLTVKSEQDFYKTYSDSTKAKELYDFFVENKLTNKDFDAFFKDIFPKGLVRSFKSGETIYDVPENKVQDFLRKSPEAIEIQSFIIGKDTFNIPIKKVTDFLNYFPDVKQLPINDFPSSIEALHQYLSQKDGFYVPLAQFRIDMLEDKNLKTLYNNLIKKDDIAISYEKFKSNILYRKSSLLNSKSLFEYWHEASPEEKMKQLYFFVIAKSPNFKDTGFNNFVIALKDEKKLSLLYKSIVRRYPEWQKFGYDSFKKELFSKNIYSELKTHSENDRISDLHFQIDKIKVGNTFIDLPFPTGFVKIDDSMGNLLEAAKKLCPETNTLLAYYISEEDYANYLVDENHICEKYILVEVFNKLKDIKVGVKEYRQFLKKYKDQYIDEFKLKIDDAEIKASENLSKIDERIKIKDLKMEPFGICYESKYSLSYGVLTKYNFTSDHENSEDFIVAGISTIIKIDGKPIFLMLYNAYNQSYDIQALKALNTSWIKEVEKRQSPGNFLKSIDFEDYKESIFAILTLSFISAIFIATKRIYRNLKNNIKDKEPKFEEKDEFLDFSELLHKDVKIKDELAVEEIVELKANVDIPENSFKVINPETLKVNRRTRFYNWLIDAILFYFIIYLPLFLFNAIINTYLYLLILFLYYFIQELLFRKTIGKFITKTNVINSLGFKPTILQLILRNASRLIPFEAFTYLSKEKRGLHDIISTTYVIKD